MSIRNNMPNTMLGMHNEWEMLGMGTHERGENGQDKGEKVKANPMLVNFFIRLK